jgi:hypothetical protein
MDLLTVVETGMMRLERDLTKAEVVVGQMRLVGETMMETLLHLL